MCVAVDPHLGLLRHDPRGGDVVVRSQAFETLNEECDFPKTFRGTALCRGSDFASFPLNHLSQIIRFLMQYDKSEFLILASALCSEWFNHACPIRMYAHSAMSSALRYSETT